MYTKKTLSHLIAIALKFARSFSCVVHVINDMTQKMYHQKFVGFPVCAAKPSKSPCDEFIDFLSSPSKLCLSVPNLDTSKT